MMSVFGNMICEISAPVLFHNQHCEVMRPLFCLTPPMVILTYR